MLHCGCVLAGKSLCVRVHDGTLRWRVTAVRRDQAYHARYTGNQGRREEHDDRLPLFTASWPYPNIEQRLTGLAKHRKHITEQSCNVISMRRRMGEKMEGHDSGWAGIKAVCVYICTGMYGLSLLSLSGSRSVAHFPHYISFSLKASCLKSLLS